jgi:dinuclear metal center YbgI/SA1388 family protein
MSDRQTHPEIVRSHQSNGHQDIPSDILVRDVMQAMETIAPAELAEPWDRIGLQIGDPASPVSGILIALDLTPDVLQSARRYQANLIICHHPVIFAPILTFRRDDPIQRLLMDAVLAHNHVFVAHTNLDAAPGGVADTWASHVCQSLGFPSTTEKVTPYGRLIVLDQEQTLDKVHAAIAAALPGSACRSNLQLDQSRSRRVNRIAAFPGSFPLETMADLIEAGIDTVMCGECKYHDGLTLALAGIAAISVGHDHSEQPVLDVLRTRLAGMFPQIPFAVHSAIDYNKQAN